MARTFAALIRHGEYGQQPDTPSAHQPYALTASGRDGVLAQADRFAAFMKRRKLAVADRIDSSNMLRAWETALIFVESLYQHQMPSTLIDSYDALAERGMGAAANLTVSHASIGHLTSVCSRAAEIVGSGPSIDLVFAGFRGSPTHWSVLSDPGWTSMGTASAQGADGKLYVAVVFCEGAGGSSAPPPPQTPPPAPASPPAHTPPADESTPAQPAARSPLAEKTVPDIEVDLVGLLTAILTTSLDSLTAEDDLDDPIASLLERYVQLPVGLKIL